MSDFCLSESKLYQPHPILNLVQGHHFLILFLNTVLQTKPDDQDDQDDQKDQDEQDNQDDQSRRRQKSKRRQKSRRR